MQKNTIENREVELAKEREDDVDSDVGCCNWARVYCLKIDEFHKMAAVGDVEVESFREKDECYAEDKERVTVYVSLEWRLPKMMD